MASVSVKCHLCGTYLSETAPTWEVGGRRLVELRCLDQRCATIRVMNRSNIGIILPDKEIVSYRLLVQQNEKWYRIWARRNQVGPDDTTIYSLDIGYPGAMGGEKHIINVPRYYPLFVNDDIKAKSLEFLSKLRTFIVFS